MFLILLLVLVAVLGYYLARWNLDQKASDAAQTLTTKAVEVGSDVGDRVTNLTRREKKQAAGFITWANGPGAKDLPADFASWWGSQSAAGQKKFSEALASYADGLGLKLSELTSGRLDSQPEYKSVFVETLVIYSNAYRKVAKAKNQPKTPASDDGGEAAQAPAAEMQPAEKARSRRSQGAQPEPTPSAA